jgi:hypothetical protein
MSGIIRVFSCSLEGSGTINADLFNRNGGSVGPGNSPGLLSVIGDYTQDATSSLLIEIGGLTAAIEVAIFV